jgi:hypothetical protein
MPPPVLVLAGASLGRLLQKEDECLIAVCPCGTGIWMISNAQCRCRAMEEGEGEGEREKEEMGKGGHCPLRC